METKPIIEIENLKKRYKMGQIGATTLKADWESFWAKVRGKEDPNVKIGMERLVGQTFMAVNGINLKVYPGEALGIIGVNGAGKSTMLKLISRITAPTEGRITLRGKVASLLEVGTGFNPELTGRENIYLNGTILGMKKEEIDAKMNDIIEFSECREFIDTPVKRYSSGMYVKLAFSVAANLDSDILIMDEVLAVGDVKFQRKCIDRMNEAVASEGKTVLYVSHNMATIRQLCKRCVVLKEGKIIFDGDVEEAIKVYSEESFTLGTYHEFKQPENIPGHVKAILKDVTILDTESLVYDAGQKMRFRIGCRGVDDYDDLTIRCNLRFSGTNVIGMCFSDPVSVKKDTDGYFTVSLDLSSLVVGKYAVDLYLGQMTMGRFIIHSEQIRAFGFEIGENKNQKGLNWIVGYWGYNVLPPIEVTENTYEES